MSRLHRENHLVARIGWLRAAVLGANDGIISTASLILGVAAAASSQSDVLLTGVAGLVAGAMSMAADAVFPVLAALTTNTVSKIVFAWSSGSRSFALRLIPGLVLVAAAAWAGALLTR